ncbi:hypothetical protein TUM20985_35300 [Mycobacterium antarcticum]|uniref:hypothetical protein n=1 Tax=unclassified Mycolicibacterium TaxID=2636767 RepID=UPI0023A07BB6|nr:MULTISPECIES: hypothetical protein [unclassified Mycolicibacterium]BDX32983.1 hypothetical protein TUM20985_35300 [Mycolicibacterium sp. TUM20985]GLP76161.1 hypothetical protein TUM20983_32710 [Mycolicibacterium sp. TUM20983]GLP83459.1 hypothetical protein TUM20984_48790 [Mycolicibacterium sp. TUM20984]
MAGIADIALAGAPIAGGALLGVVAGNLRAPDVRAVIKQDMELLKLLPAEQVERRAELQRVIDIRIDDMIAAVDKQRSMLEIAASYRGNWRDVVVFVCAILFTIIWWYTDHTRNNYWVMFVVMIAVSIAAGIYAGRGVLRAIRTYARGLRSERGQ